MRTSGQRLRRIWHAPVTFYIAARSVTDPEQPHMIDYSQASETYDQTRSHSEDVIDRIDRIIAFDSSTTVLNFGSGTGNYLVRIRQRFGSVCCGVEPSDAMRAKAEAKCSELRIGAGDHRPTIHSTGPVAASRASPVNSNVEGCAKPLL